MALLSSAVVVAHSAMAGHDMGDAAVVCLAVAETAAAVAAAAAASRAPRGFAAVFPLGSELTADRRPLPASPVWARAGPRHTQVLRL